MAETLEFDLVTPAKLLLSEQVEMVVLPGGEGDLGILPGHAPLISTVRPGTVDIHEGGKVVKRIFVQGGFTQVSDDVCTLLAEEAVNLDDVTSADAQAKLSEAKAALEAADEVGKAKAEEAVAAAEALVAAVG